MKCRTDRPFVFVNMAMSADGKIATANRRYSSFGSSRDQAHLLELRATADAVMAGARTVDLNRVLLGPGPAKYRRLRLQRGLAEYNLRIIVSRSGSIDPKAYVFARNFSPILILTTAQAGVRKIRELRKIAAEVRVCGTKEINWPTTLAWLRRKWKVRRLLCEGGGELNDALFQARVVDELHLTICPLIIGGHQAPTIADAIGVPSLGEAARFELKELRRNGPEIFTVFRAKPSLVSRKSSAPRPGVPAAKADPTFGSGKQ